MKILPTRPMPDESLISSTIPYPDASMGESLYDPLATYAIGDAVLVGRARYVSLVNGNTGNDPETSQDKWLLSGTANRWRIFDYGSNAASIQSSGVFAVSISPPFRVTDIALIGMVGLTVRLVGTAPDYSVIYDSGEVSISRRMTDSWSDYFFGEFFQLRRTIFSGIPPALDAVFSIEIDGGAGQAGVASVVMGQSSSIGRAEGGAVDGALNFSTIQRNQFGDAQLVQRRVVPTLSISLFCSASEALEARLLRERIAGQPAVWVGTEDDEGPYYQNVFVFGPWRNFPIRLEQASITRINLEIEDI